MNRRDACAFAWCACLLLSGFTTARPHEHDAAGGYISKESPAPTIVLAKPEASDTTLRVPFEIRNDSGRDVWICDDFTVFLHDYDAEVYMTADHKTLRVRRRLDVDPCSSVSSPPHGRYVRLPDGQSRRELLFLSLPVKSRFFWARPRVEGRADAGRLVLEIGYYAGDMPTMIRGVINGPAQRQPIHVHGPYVVTGPPPLLKDWFVSMVHWNWWNWPGMHIRHRGEEILIPWTGSERVGEQVLRVSLDGLKIPYEEGYERATVPPLDLSGCKRLEILYSPSVLDYFFHYQNERGLMNSEELAHLRSLRQIIVDDPAQIAVFSREISRPDIAGAIVPHRSCVRFICHGDQGQFTAFTLYDDRAIITEEGRCIRCSTGIPSLKSLTPQIRPFQLRLDCANNLMNLWSPLHLLYGAQKAYLASKWCDAFVNDRQTRDIPKDRKARCLQCPSDPTGRCHYAMNPHCKRNSPADMVLLFETKDGWNQHGGPELFSFDNHNPRGGLVLLNDGTTRFIRTQEELRQLRWK